MLARLEQPDGSLAASASGDARVIASITSTAALAMPVAAAVAAIAARAAGAGHARQKGSAPGPIWLAAAATGAVAVHGAASGTYVLLHGALSRVLTLLLIAAGGVSVLLLLRHQRQMLREAQTQQHSSNGKDVEAGLPHVSVWPAL